MTHGNYLVVFNPGRIWKRVTLILLEGSTQPEAYTAWMAVRSEMEGTNVSVALRRSSTLEEVQEWMVTTLPPNWLERLVRRMSYEFIEMEKAV
jgi:hypothetical protein